LIALFSGGERTSLPPGVESVFVKTPDEKQLEVWRLAVAESRYVAIVFHGNAGDVENFFVFQQYLQTLGITSYGFDYRGFGKSSGWPSEEGLYIGSDTVIDYVLDKEGVDPDSLILVGVSIGSGPASYSA